MKQSKIVFIIITTLTVFTLVGLNLAFAATFVVDRTDDSIAANQCTAAANNCSLRGAITKADSDPGDDIITVPAGTYQLTIASTNEDNNIDGDLDILGTNGSVTINGAGSGTTFIQAGAAFDAGIDRVFNIQSSATVSISDVTIRFGDLNLATAGGGGGIRSHSNSNLTLTNVVVSQNNLVADGSWANGGGIDFTGDTLTLTNVAIVGNQASNTGSCQGGGIVTGGNTTMTTVTVAGNSCISTTGDTYGGGICDDGNSLVLTNFTVSGNTATSGPASTAYGGGVGSTGSASGQFSNGAVTGNLANTALGGNGNGAGGGIFYDILSSLTIQDVAVSGNAAQASVGGRASGGGIDFVGTTLTLTNVTIDTNNTGNLPNIDSPIGSTGGALDFSGTTATLTNVTLSGNSARSGGGSAYGGSIYADMGNVTLLNVTIYENLASSPGGSAVGGGIYFNFGGANSIALRNTLVANNSTAGVLHVNCNGSITSNGNNLDSGNTCGFTPPNDIINFPMAIGTYVSALQNNGGPTATHALLQNTPANPAIDGGDNTGVLFTDQRGYVRIWDGDGNGTAVVDIGAFEYDSQILAIPTINQWGMIFFVVLAGTGAVYYLRRHRKSNS